jgi:23S rRNA pseudouridine2604 synthase
MDAEFPMRINKYLASRGIATRRDADELVQKGLVLINGSTAMLGDKVQATDEVTVLKRGKGTKQYAYFAYNKPRGDITPQRGGEGDEELPPQARELGLFPVGRLDRDSRGLLLLTNDGRITNRLLNPDKDHEKEYAVKVKKPLRKNFKEYMERGVDIGGYTTKPSRVRITGERTFSISLTEGKKHQIRRMVVALFNEVDDLRRTRIMNVRLGNLAAGEMRPVEGDELVELLASLGLA